jgi:hypothetical protein
MSDDWRRRAGNFDTVAGYERLQASRPGLGLLLLARGVPVAYIKLRKGETSPLLNEVRAHDQVWRFRPRSFFVPEPVGVGEVAGWYYFIVRPLPARLHRPPQNPRISAIVEEIGAALAEHPRPPSTPDHWRPMHGDFAPWNLRLVGKHALALIDWECAAWGPPGADEVLYRASQVALRGGAALTAVHLEALRYWEERTDRWNDNVRDSQFGFALRRALREVRSRLPSD